MADQNNDFKLMDIWGAQPVQDTASDTMGYLGNINPRKAESDALSAAEVTADLKTNSLSIKGLPMNKAQEILGKATATDQIQALYQQKIGEIEARIAQQKKHPFMNTMAQIAAAIAAGDREPSVRSLGALAQRLNPTVGQLQEQELEVLGKAGTYAQGERRLSLEEKRMTHDTRMLEYQRKTTADQQLNIGKLLQEARLAVKPGSGTPLSYTAFQNLATAKNIPTQLIPGLYETHKEEAKLAEAGKESDLARAKSRMTFKENLDETLAGKRGEISLGTKIKAIDHAFNNSISQSRMDYDLKLHEQKKAIDEAAAGRKELSVLGPKPQEMLKQASATNQYLGSSQIMLEQPEMAEVQGPLFQLNPATNEVKLNPQAVMPKAFQNVDRTVVQSQIAHEIPRLLTLLLNGQAGGASILRTDIGKKLVQDMGITGSIRVDQALRILKIVRDSNNNNITAIMREKPTANWGAMQDLLGVNDPLNKTYFYDKKDSFGGPLKAFPSFERRSTTKESAETKKYPWEK